MKIRRRYRLYWHIYLSFVGVIVLFAILAVGAWHLRPADSADRQWIDKLSVLLGELLTEQHEPAMDIRQRIERLAGQLDVELALYDARRRQLTSTEPGLPAPAVGQQHSRLIPRREGGPGAIIALPDGRWLVARGEDRSRGSFPVALLLLALAIAVGSHPLARRITRRLEALQRATQRMAQGDLSARAEVRGRDEIAALASGFNAAAQRIQALVEAQGSTLASASHELRSPLARIRMALELYAGTVAMQHDGEGDRLKARIERDLDELDVLIEELLLASRLAAVTELDGVQTVDLLAMAAEEAARLQCEPPVEVDGEPVLLRGSERLLRRLLRNLLENAERHAAGGAIRVRVRAVSVAGDKPDGLQSDDGRDHARARITVDDTGPGVPESERERIFTPFYRPAGTAEGGGGGVGLGLSLVRDIARRHQGEVHCDEAPGGGTRIRVELGTIAEPRGVPPHD
ncbi:MAG: HAMP domain-containing histidine kinase [Gammaproteobacteria bacterium]|nr:HAMP domain-containing histidine kinase [Gammaproteobacteria bacterium]